MTRVLVCGSRHLTKERDWTRIHDALLAYHVHPQRGPITCLIHGAARGADRLAAEWAKSWDIPVRSFAARWQDIYAPGAVIKHTLGSGKPYNAVAGFQRNQRMLIEGKPDFCIAFKRVGARNAGTQDMIDRCCKAGIQVFEA